MRTNSSENSLRMFAKDYKILYKGSGFMKKWQKRIPILVILTVIVIIILSGVLYLSKNNSYLNKESGNREEESQMDMKDEQELDSGAEINEDAMDMAESEEESGLKQAPQDNEATEQEELDYIKGRPLTEEEIEQQKELEPEFPGGRGLE